MTEGGKKPPLAFERDKPGTNARTEAEADIEALRKRGGLFVEAVGRTRMPMAVTDARLPGNPIVFANDAFIRLSGYSMLEVLGQQPHFLNGPDTDPRDAAEFREALRRGEDIVVESFLYRKDGSRFFAALFVSPVADEDGQVIQHFLSYLDITRRVEAEEEIRGHAADLEARVADRVAALNEELRCTRILQNLGARLLTEGDIQTLQEEILTAAIEITRARAGTVQVLDEEAGELVVLATRGFSPRTEEYFRRVDARSNTSCGLALRTGERSYFDFDPASTDIPVRMHVEEGVRSAQSSPLISRAGKPIGMVSTHWGDPDHRLSERELRFLDLLARQAADLIEQGESEAALRRSEEHQRVLVAELQHRVRNTLGVVRSIARRTAQNSDSVEEMVSHLDGRLDAFARVQAIVTRRPEAGINLAALIEDELVAHATREGPNVTLDGPDVALFPRPAEMLSLAIHELTTNAVKYGALSSIDGRVAIGWTLADGRFDLGWTESGVPNVPAAPAREGFGMELLCRVVPYELSAETAVTFLPDGLRFTLSMPVDGNIGSR